MVAKRVKFEEKKPYHVYNRGFCKRYIFKTDKNIKFFLRKMLCYSEKYDVTITAFSILPNHFHLLIRQNEENGIAKFIRSLQLSYAKYFNKKHKRRGPVFDGRYNAILVDDKKYFFNIHNYIFNNPTKHKKFTT